MRVITRIKVSISTSLCRKSQLVDQAAQTAGQPGQQKRAAGQTSQQDRRSLELEPAAFNREDLDIPTFLRKRVGK